jgi:transcriptional regulator with XRE-family HTH domain
MPHESRHFAEPLKGHALRNAHLRQRSLARAETAPPLARALVHIRADLLGMTRLEFVRRSGISRGTLRDVELGIHVPTRRVLQRFVSFCQKCSVAPERLEELRRLYAGSGATLREFIARLELKAGSSRELARSVGISPATLWEYKRGNFPLPVDLLRKLCRAVGQDSVLGEALWHETERRRLLDRGYPEALAEFWVLCARSGRAEKHLPALGLSTTTVRRLRYLEIVPWKCVAEVARVLCRNEAELTALKTLWERDELRQRDLPKDGFGPGVHLLRKQRGVSRRELADLFGVGGKKPARIIKHVEEDGFYSARAYPAGLVAVLTEDEAERERLLALWRERRSHFHQRHRPETRVDLRLAREQYGFDLGDMKPLLGYSSLEYQKIERGVTPLRDAAHQRILEAITLVGQGKIEALLQWRSACESERDAWRSPATVADLIELLAQREGGLIPLTRLLRRAGLKGLWTARLRALARGADVPPWTVLEGIARAGGVSDVLEVRRDWYRRYRDWLRSWCASPLGVELRLLIAETAPTLRAFSPRLGFNYSVLVRDMQRIDRDEHVKWFHVERILRAAGLPPEDDRWREIHALWYTAGDRKKRINQSWRGTNGQAERA